MLMPTASGQGQQPQSASSSQAASCWSSCRLARNPLRSPVRQPSWRELTSAAVCCLLQDCNCRAQRLLTLLSIHREQVRGWLVDVQGVPPDTTSQAAPYACGIIRELTLYATLLSGLQGIAAHAGSVDRLFSEALTCIVQALQAAAAAKQPLLTASSQHSR